MRTHLKHTVSYYDLIDGRVVPTPGALTRFWRDLTGASLREEHRRLARRVAELENADNAPPPRQSRTSDHVNPPPDAAAENADFAGLQRAIELIKIVQRETTVRLNELAASVETTAGEGRDALTEVRAAQQALAEGIAAWEQQLAAFPEQWRADLEARIDALRETPDAANAALLGVAAFTKSISAQLREER